MEKQQLLALIAKVVPDGAREMVPHAIKEPIVNLFSTEKPPPPPHFLELPQVPRASFDAAWQEVFGSSSGADRATLEAQRNRHAELCNAIAYFFPDWRYEIQVLEIGPSGLEPLYKRLFPRMEHTLASMPPPTGGKYDLVICAEGAPLAPHVELLKPHGLLYVTAPNRQPNAMAELHAETVAAGGRVITSYFSAWRDAKPPLRREERSTLVAVLARKL